MVSKNRINKTKYLKLMEQDMKFCGLTESTKEQYRFVVNRYLDFTNNDPNFSRQEIMQFVSSLGNVTSTYQAWVLSIVKRFHKTIKDILPVEKKKWPLGPREGPRPEVRPQPFLTKNNIDRLFSLTKKSNIRDYAMSQLFTDTIMRCDELSKLNKSDYDGKNIHIKLSKRESYRVIELSVNTKEAVNNYLEGRNDNKAALFLDSRGNRMSPANITRVMKQYFVRLKIYQPRMGSHSFRRGGVTDLIKKGMTEIPIARFGGWKSTAMVNRYAQLTTTEVGKEVRKLGMLRE